MTEQSSSVLALISTTVLSSHKVLALLQAQPFHKPISAAEMHEAVYLGYLPWAARQPDHVFERSWQLLSEQPANKDRGFWLPGALQALAAECLEPRHGKLHVKRSKFGAWQQSVLSRICGLPVQAAAHAWPLVGAYVEGLDQPHSLRAPEMQTWAGRNLPVLTPHDGLVEDYLSREGLHETHLHLNGSTHAEQCWLRALYQPEAETRDFNDKWMEIGSTSAQKIRELARAINPALSPTELRRQLYVARRLREWLIAAATGALNDASVLPANYAALNEFEASSEIAPAPRDDSFELGKDSNVVDELRWQQQLLRHLDSQPSIALERMLHCYLLLQNQHYRLLVQSEEQFGFDQFQKLTYTDLREPTEKSYLNRFLAMHGKHGNSRTGYLEGRFAPKASLEKNQGILHAILVGYLRYLSHNPATDDTPPKCSLGLSTLLDKLDEAFQAKSQLDRKHQRLALVAHFIKQPWSHTSKKAGPYRFYGLRTSLESTANALIQTLNSWPRLRTWVRGIDAAANELHAPPEVFASIYRVCKQAGLTRRSYHAGEDFPHLLSGLRHMFDALELLELRDGDRIGHGTAMGISPQLWLDRMPGQLVVKKGEWMLDLLAVWRLLRRFPGASAETHRVECELAERASHVFGRDVSCAALERAMKFRHLNLRYLQAAQDANWSLQLTPFSDLWHAEATLVEKAKVNNRQDLELLWEWQSDTDLWQRSEALESVEAGYFSAVIYLQLQQALMKEVAKRGVLIETLPSSNVRISQYHNFKEHHALRWMRVPGFVQEGDPEIMVTLGSDDPGIFAGDLNSEFYQLYSALRNHGLSDDTALKHLAPLNERGRQYRFHDTSIG